MNAQVVRDPFVLVLDALRSRSLAVRACGPERARAQCPAHGGTGLSLSVARSEAGGVLLHCHSRGCTASEIAAALGLRVAALFPPPIRAGVGGQHQAPTPSWYGVIPCIDGSISVLERALAGDATAVAQTAVAQVRTELLNARRAAVAALRAQRAAERRAACNPMCVPHVAVRAGPRPARHELGAGRAGVAVTEGHGYEGCIFS